MVMSNVEKQRVWYARTKLSKEYDIERELAKSIVVTDADIGQKLSELWKKLPSFRSLTISLVTSGGLN